MAATLLSVSTQFEKQVKPAVKHCSSADEQRVVYSTNELLSAINKYVLPALQKINVIYQFSYHSDSRFVGRTSQRLQDRIKQHVPKSTRLCSSSQKRIISPKQHVPKSSTQSLSLPSDSAIELPVCKLKILRALEKKVYKKSSR